MNTETERFDISNTAKNDTNSQSSCSDENKDLYIDPKYDRSKELNCGIFDSAKIFKNVRETKERLLTCFEIEYLLTDGGASFIDGIEYPHLKNALIIAHPGQRRKSKLPFKCYYLHFDLDESDPFYATLMNAKPFLYLLERDEYIQIFENIIRYHIAKKLPLDSVVIKAEMTKLFYFISADLKLNSTHRLDTMVSTNELISTTVSYVNDNLDKNLSLDTLSQVTFYSKNYLRTVFKQVLGISPQEYVLNKRIEKAKIMLADQSLPLADIALECGFTSQSYFNYVYKKQCDLTPKEARQLYISQFINTDKNI